ncbi:hypothetical protein THIOSC13_810008 [uncultured Thiomicrorhabdus sp.]
MAKLYDVSATLGTYTKDGEKKYISRNVGSIIETKNGPMLLIDSSLNLAALDKSEDGKVWLKLFEPKTDNDW